MTTSRSPHSAGSDIHEVLAMFRSGSPMTRAEVMARTGLSRSTANQRIDALIAAGLVAPAESGQSTGGRPPGLFEFARTRGVLLVADIGATAMRMAVCDLGGTVLDEVESRIAVADGPQSVLDQVDKHFQELLDKSTYAAAQVMGIGVDVPGPVDFDSGRVVSPPIMTGWDRFDIPGWFALKYDCPVVVDKDVNAMAVGEHRTVFPEVSHLMMLKIGTGVGSGLIAGGSVHRGADGAAGDIGHIQLTLPDGDGEGPLCRCGNYGCVEAYAGGWAMARDLREAGKDVETVDDVLACLQAGDIEAQQLLRRAGRILGRAVADAVNLFNPRIIAVCGQLAHTDEHLLAGIREVVYRRSLPLATRNLQIVRSRLDPRGGVVGLSALLADEIFSEVRLNRLIA